MCWRDTPHHTSAFHFLILYCLRKDLYLFTVQIFHLPQWVCSWWWCTLNDSLKVNLSRGDFQTARVSRQLTYSPQGNISQGNLPLSAGEGERPQLHDLRPARAGSSCVMMLQLVWRGPGGAAVTSQCWPVIPPGCGGQLLRRFWVYWAMNREPEVCDCHTQCPLVCCKESSVIY